MSTSSTKTITVLKKVKNKNKKTAVAKREFLPTPSPFHTQIYPHTYTQVSHWCFTPSQPLRLYQGERMHNPHPTPSYGGEKEEGEKTKQKGKLKQI